MKYVALLSGGKDSCFNLLHCHLLGHHLVAAASLRPPPGNNDEVDSFMYQSVGQDAIHLIAKALGVPLYRAYINGSAIDQSLEYNTHGQGIEGDETEDLLHLLTFVKVLVHAFHNFFKLTNYVESKLTPILRPSQLVQYYPTIKELE